MKNNHLNMFHEKIQYYLLTNLLLTGSSYSLSVLNNSLNTHDADHVLHSTFILPSSKTLRFPLTSRRGSAVPPRQRNKFVAEVRTKNEPPNG